MSTIVFPDGKKVKFEGNPTPQDVDFVAQKIGVSPGSATPEAPKTTPVATKTTPVSRETPKKPLIDRAGSFFAGKLPEYIGTKIAKATVPEAQKKFVDEGPSAKQAAGGALQLASFFTPIGRIAKGATAVARAAGIGQRAAKIGGGVVGGGTAGLGFDVAQDIQEGTPIRPGFGTAIGAGIPLAGPLIKTAASVAGKGLGITTGAGQEAGRIGFEAVKAGGERAQAFRAARRGQITPAEVVTEARGALDDIVNTRRTEYQQSLGKLKESTRTFNIAPVHQKFEKKLAEFNINKVRDPETGQTFLDFSRSRVRFDKSAQDEVNTIFEQLRTFGGRPGDRTVVGIDNLKQAIGELYSKSSPVRALTTAVKSATREVLRPVKDYNKMTESYEKSTKLINEIRSALSLGDKPSIDTAFRKLASSIRQNFPERQRLVQELDELTGGTLFPKIAGIQTREVLPRGLIGRATGIVGGTASFLTGATVFGLLKVLAITSPRLLGIMADALGIGARGAKILKDKLIGSGRVTPGDVMFDTAVAAKKKISEIPAETRQGGFIRVPGAGESKSQQGLFTTPQKTKEKGLKFLEKAFGDRESAISHADQYWAKEGKPGVFHHVTKESSPFGLFQKDKAANMHVGLRSGVSNVNGLYVGRDPKALHEFYNLAAERGDNIVTYKGNPKLLDLTDENTYQQFVKKFKTGDQIEKELSKKGYDGIKYFDPYATGEEIVIANQKALEAVAFNGKPIKTNTPSVIPKTGQLIKITDKATGKSSEKIIIRIKDDGTIVSTHKDILFPGRLDPAKFDIEYLGKEVPLPKRGETFGEINKREAAEEAAQRDTFQGFQDITTKVLDRLKGKTQTSKQEILDFTNMPELKQTERELIRRIADEYKGGKIPVKEFADKVKTELLPLTPVTSKGAAVGGSSYNTRQFQSKFENITLPEDSRGPVANYFERIYNSPIKTSAGDIHFSSVHPSNRPGYFSHTRIEDLPLKGTKPTFPEYQGPAVYKSGDTRRVIELQSDLFQKGRLEREGKLSSEQYNRLSKIADQIGDANESLTKRHAELSKLEPYRNTWHERIIREEVKQAAVDGKTKLQFPTGQTAMQIEGLGGNRMWNVVMPPGQISPRLTPQKLKVGLEVRQIGTGDYIITDVLGDGKFKAVPKEFEKAWKDGINSLGKKIDKTQLERVKEGFDISDKTVTENPIYRFYEKEVGRYLQKKYNARIVVDPQGVKWFEVPIKKEYGKAPIEAFAAAPLLTTPALDRKE